jgi:hypothetical protein
MNNTSSISSEEELLALRAEGKISEDHYQELLGAVRKAPPKEQAEAVTESNEWQSRHKRGKIAFTMMLVGLVLPAIFFLGVQMLAPERASPVLLGPWLLLGLALELAAFVMGILAWRDLFGKAAVITIAILTVIAVLLVA